MNISQQVENERIWKRSELFFPSIMFSFYSVFEF